MFPILADLPPPDGAHFWQWCLSAAAILSIVYTGVCLWQKLFPKESPPLNEKYVHRAEHLALAEKVEQVDDKIEERTRDLERKISDRNKELFTLLRQQAEAISALKQSSDTTATEVGRLGYKLDQILLNRRP